MKSAEFPEITEYKERFIERVRRNFFSYIEQLSGEAGASDVRWWLSPEDRIRPPF